jgi:hypothetical protein
MKSLDCAICFEKLKPTARAVVSPWIRSLGVRRKWFSTYGFCKNCCSGFFNFRYSDSDMNKIYSEYRGENYAKVRARWEPWYNTTFNDGHDSEEFISMRKSSLINFLKPLLPALPKTVVDVGGDRGQYIPNFGQRKSYVIESSSKKLINGVERLNSIEQVETADLIIYSHVLEHVASPKYEIEKLLERCEKLYVEVPYGTPEISKARKSKIRFLLKVLATFYPRFWQQSTMPAAGRSPKSGILVQSEHINFFTERSFLKIAEDLRVEVHLEVNSIKTPDRAEALVIQCLFVPRM